MADSELLRTPKFRVVEIDVVARDGTLQQRFVVRHPGAAVILPVLADGRILLIRNHRLSVGRELIELPAGTLDPGEDPSATAARELAEETG
jgi:ADP-ribose pyrophosphatase